jgi:hypothetical protein
MCWVVEVANVNCPNTHANNGDDFRELLAELVQLLLQRRLLLLRFAHLLANLAYLRVHSGTNNDALAFARRYVCALPAQQYRYSTPRQYCYHDY